LDVFHSGACLLAAATRRRLPLLLLLLPSMRTRSRPAEHKQGGKYKIKKEK
jgi:hypothetical protein